MAANEKLASPSGANTPEDDKYQYYNSNNNEEAEDLLTIIVRSVEAKQRRESARKVKRKRECLKKPQANGSDADDENNAYSRCTISFFVKVIKRVKSVPKYVCLVRWMGFGELLELDDCIVPRGFVQWIADNVHTEEEMIRIGSKMIELSAEAVTDTLGTPAGEMLVQGDEVSGKAAFLDIFGLTEVPSFRFLGKMILRKEILSDAVFCRCFMGVALPSFLCPNSSTKVSTKYMGALVVVEDISQRNWSKFVHDWMIEYIKKYHKLPLKDRRMNHTLGGCIYHLGIRLLDFVDFGPVKLPSTFPRIRVWKGNLIKVFSEMFMGTKGKYGAYPIRDFSETCYFRVSNDHHEPNVSAEYVQASIETAIGNLVSSKLKENITAAYTSMMKNKCLSAHNEVQELVLHIIRAIVSNEMLSGDTEKLPSSQEDVESFECANDTASRRNVQENKHVIVEIESHDGHLVHEKKRRTEHVDPMPPAKQSTEFQRTIREASTSIPMQSMSLDHMIQSTATRFDNKSSQDKDVSLDLNVNAIQEEDNDFSFMKQDNEKQSSRSLTLEVQHEISVPTPTVVKLDIDVNFPNPSSNVQPLKPMKRSVYIQNARHKYHWNDPSYPNFRISDNEDDNGKTIEEIELIRPIGMSDFDYFKKIEDAIVYWELREVEEEEACEAPNETKLSSQTQQDNSTRREYEMSVQCAQNVPSKTGLTNSPVRKSMAGVFFVDLGTPEPAYTSQEHFKSTNSCSTSTKNTDYSKAMLIGRKLFHSNEDNYNSPWNKTNTRNLIELSSDESPEVAILREKIFKVTTNQASKSLDAMYNTSLTLGSPSCYRGKENARPQRVIQRSRFITSPYDINQKITVLPIHEKVWQSITTLCDDPNHNITSAINIGGVKVSMFQLGSSMKINAKVEAWVINAFCRKLFKDKHPRVSSKHYFFNIVSEYFLEKWKNEDGRLYFKKRALDSFIGAGSARPLIHTDRLWFPSIQSDHWFVFLVDMKSKNFIFLDSVFGEESKFHNYVWRRMIPKFIEIWNESGQDYVNFDDFGKIYPNVPKQKPGNDCGIYTMRYMETFDPRNPLQCSFSSTDIPLLRIRYGHDMIMSDHNTEDDAKFLVCKSDS